MGGKVHREKLILPRRAKHVQAAHEKRLSSDFEAEDCRDKAASHLTPGAHSSLFSSTGRVSRQRWIDG
jgi:hypothetical protein